MKYLTYQLQLVFVFALAIAYQIAIFYFCIATLQLATRSHSPSLRLWFILKNASLVALYICARAGLRKCGARLEALLRGPTQWREQKFLWRTSSHNYEWHERPRPEKGNAKLVSGPHCQFHLCRRDFSCSFDGHIHNNQ